MEPWEETVVGVLEEAAEVLEVETVDGFITDVLGVLGSFELFFGTFDSPFEEPVGSVVELRVVMLPPPVPVEVNV